MRRTEYEELVDCNACGTTVDPSTDRVFAFGAEDDFLCWECAVQRGGAWDEDLQVWSTAPRVEGLVTAPPELREPVPV